MLWLSSFWLLSHLWYHFFWRPIGYFDFSSPCFIELDRHVVIGWPLARPAGPVQTCCAHSIIVMWHMIFLEHLARACGEQSRSTVVLPINHVTQITQCLSGFVNHDYKSRLLVLLVFLSIFVEDQRFGLLGNVPVKIRASWKSFQTQLLIGWQYTRQPISLLHNMSFQNESYLMIQAPSCFYSGRCTINDVSISIVTDIIEVWGCLLGKFQTINTIICTHTLVCIHIWKDWIACNW